MCSLIKWDIVVLVTMVLSLDALTWQAHGSIVANQKHWVLAGSDIKDWTTGSPLCSQVSMNALGRPYTNDSAPGFNRSVGLYTTRFKPNLESNALWSYNASTMALQMEWLAPPVALYCLDNMNQTSYNQDMPFPFKLMPCTGQSTQQWFLEYIFNTQNATTYKIRSAMLAEDGDSLYIHGQNFLNTEYPWLVLGLYLRSSQKADENSFSTFTFIPVPDGMRNLAAFAVAIPSRGDGLNNLVANGGFESCGLKKPNDYTMLEITVNKNSPYICSWTVLQGRVKIVQTSAWSWQAKEGLNSLLLTAPDAGKRVVVAQCVSTVINAKYQLSFYVYGGRVCQLNQLNVTKLLNLNIFPTSNSSLRTQFSKEIFVSQENQPVDWELIVVPFAALGNVTAIQFINTMKGECAVAIDHVVVSPIVEPPQEKPVSKKLLIVTCFTSGMSVVGFFLLIKDRVFGLNLLHMRKGVANVVHGDWMSDSSLELGPVNTFSLKQLKAATNNFKTKVGEGGFGTVYRAKLPDGRVVAVKRASFALTDAQFFRQELSVLLRLRHEKLVNLLGFCCEKGEQILVFEFINNSSLYERLHGNSGRKRVLQWEQRMQIVLDIAKALHYLHDKAVPPVIHRDVKSSNILLTEEDEGRLADFGLSKLVTSSQETPSSTPPRGSYGYIDPHYSWTGKLSEKSDVYSYGIVVLEMVTGLKAMQKYKSLAEWTRGHRGDLQSMASIVDPKLEGKFPIEELCKVTQIMNACLSEMPDDRPSMKQIVALLGS